MIAKFMTPCFPADFLHEPNISSLSEQAGLALEKKEGLKI